MRILIVEDEILLSELLKRSLKQEGYGVEVVEDGLGVLAALKERAFDLVVLDINLPHKDGYTLCKEIRQKYTMPIVMLTSRSEIDDKIRGLDLGADDYVLKPFDVTELHARIRSLLRRPKTLLNDEVLLGDLKINHKLHRASLNNIELEIKPKAYLMLYYLLQYSDRYVSKDELLEYVWGVLAETSGNRVEVCAVRIRELLAENKSIVSLKTLHKVGYRLII
jgi:two-component system, OmpR family, response regulator